MSIWTVFHGYLDRNKLSYQEYLQSSHWKDVRARFYKSKLCKNKCECCGSLYKLNLHHRTYKRIGKERLNDLCLLCEDCHKKLHEIYRKHKSKNPRTSLWGITKNFTKKGKLRIR